MLSELLKTVLAIVIGAGLRALLAAIGVEIDPVLFNTIVTGIVTWILIQLGLEAAARVAPRYFTVKK
jgi:hypothetical protein